MQGQASQASGGSGKIKPFYPNAYKEINPQAKKTLPSGAWNPGGPNSTARPKPGDLLVLGFAKPTKTSSGIEVPRRAFSHIAVFRSAQPVQHQAGGEKWISIDGGGLTGKESHRIFDESTGTVKDINRTDDGTVTNVRLVLGHIDIEKFN